MNSKMSSQSVEIEIQSYRLQKRKDHIRAVIPILYFRIMNSFAILEDHNEVGAPPAPDAVGDYVGRVGDELNTHLSCVLSWHVLSLGR